MNELLILGIVYMVFSYLYMLGYTTVAVGGEIKYLGKVGWTIIAFAPITLPIALGAARSND